MKAQMLYERLKADAQSVTRGEIKQEVLRLYRRRDRDGMRELFHALVEGMPQSPYDRQIATPEARLLTAADSLDLICAMADAHLRGELILPSTLMVWSERFPEGKVRDFYWESIVQRD